ncbi:HotDog domain-containing protein [Triangularia verruculosa]|uniref:HotDog domain-containing protein n=1 Tax=Triangularia verruculosa TaxID=2587418 RepID=A0AAN6XPG1_9PEZI|nr:HotDog domain-containing protein [Triangularia verruculosa]
MATSKVSPPPSPPPSQPQSKQSQEQKSEMATPTSSDISSVIDSPANKAQEAHHIAFFNSIPWCSSLLSSTPNLIVSQSVSRIIRPSGCEEDALLSQTLNSPDAIPAYITFYSPPPKPTDHVYEVKSLIALGPKVNGWEGICHGGIVMTLLDEVMGQLFAVNKDSGAMDSKMPVLTGFLNTAFKKPVRTGTKEKPAIVLVVARLTKMKGRKHFCEGVVYGDGEGKNELARAEALFVQLRESKI